MRSLWLLLLLVVPAPAQAGFQLQKSNTTEDLRGVSVVSQTVAWASGTHGTYLRTTDGGRSWEAKQISDAAGVDFRAVRAFSAEEAFLMSAGPASQSRIYHTSDAGRHWALQFTNSNPKGFFDSMVFWDATHGIVLGDPIPDAAGQLKFELLATDDGQTWKPLSTNAPPAALDGEGAFAASNGCIAVQGANVWFVTGGRVARVFRSADRGRTWQVVETPIVHGPESAGIFSIAFRDEAHGVIAGGDYRQPERDGDNLAFTDDGGKTWKPSTMRPQIYFSAAAYDRSDNGRLFLVGTHSILDFHLPFNPAKISEPKNPDFALNAVSPFPAGGALFVGPKGTVIYAGRSHGR